MPARYRAGMAFSDVPSVLAPGSRLDERGMAAVAKAAIFREAVLAAVRARINELRTVAK
jgi:hypothetical protein